MDASILILLILTTIAVLFLAVRFFVNLKKYDYLGNIYLYIVAAYLICFIFSCFVNFGSIQVPYEKIILSNGTEGTIYPGSEDKNALVKLGTSLFDALKMMAAKFDQDVAKAYIGTGGVYKAFGYYYMGVSIFALITTSMVTMLFAFKSFGAKFLNFFRKLCPKKEIYYIFSDPEVLPAIKLAEQLKDEKKIVVMFIPSASLKTQQGTEYRDALKNKGFDVRAENFSEKLCTKLIEEHFERRFRKVFLFPWKYIGQHRKATVFGLFSKDEYSTDLAINFTNALTNISGKKKKENETKPNKHFARIEEKIKFYKGNPNVMTPEDLRKELEKWRIEEKEKAIQQVKSNADKNAIKEADKKRKEEDKQKQKEIQNQERLFALIQTYVKKLEKFKVFVTYQDADMDLSNNFSGRTLHIVNTLSQYDMISSEFILNNPIGNFIDIRSLTESNLDSLHVSFLGFGKINRPIFEKMTYAYQLWGDQKYLINYHVLDENSDEVIRPYKNEFTFAKDLKPSNDYLPKPVLYHIDSACDGRDLSSYEAINKHVLAISKKKDRFDVSGFEIFIISLCNTNTDIKVALQLRQTLIKHIKPEKLAKTIIFVRIGNANVGEAFAKQNNDFVVAQDTLNVTRLEKLNKVVPIVIFGQNTTMAKFVKNHYEILDKLGFYSLKAYNKHIKDDKLRTLATQVGWITDNKTEVLGNIAPVYTLKTKLEIFGHKHNNNFEVNDSLKKITNNLLLEINDLQKNCEDTFKTHTLSSDKLFKLAELEHNRWNAATYLFRKPTRMSLSHYFTVNEYQFNGKRFRSRDSGTTIHICMTTNEGLKNLYALLEEKKESSVVPKDKKVDFEEESIKLVFENDIEQLKEALNYIVKDDEEKNKTKKEPKNPKQKPNNK